MSNTVNWYGDCHGDCTLCHLCYTPKAERDELPDYVELLTDVETEGVRLECDCCRILQVPENDPDDVAGVHYRDGVVVPLRNAWVLLSLIPVEVN